MPSPFNVCFLCITCADEDEVHDAPVIIEEDVLEATMRHITGNILKGSVDVKCVELPDISNSHTL